MPQRSGVIVDSTISRLFKRAARNEELSAETVYEVIESHLQRPVQVTAGRAVAYSKERLRSRSGNLGRSIIGRVIRIDGVPAAQIGVLDGPAARYAGPQELGTRRFNPRSPYSAITPKKAKALAFAPPGSPVLTGAGVDRYGGPRKVPWELVFIPIRKGNVVGALYRAEDLATTKGENQSDALRRANTVYLLLKKVSLRPNFFLRDGMRDGIKKDLVPAVRAALREVIIGETQ